MKFSLNKSTLLREVNLLQGVVEKKNTIPILSNVLVESAGQSKLSLVGTDLDVSMQTSCVADVTQEGAVVLQARKLFDIVRNLPDSEIHFQREDNDSVRITCESSEFKLLGQAKEHFPSTPFSEDSQLSMGAATLNSLIVRTIFSITQEESRYALNGALFNVKDGKLQMVATDGHRLALAVSSLPDGVDPDLEEIRVIVPKKALVELMKLTMGSDATVSFGKDENHIYFNVDGRHLSSRVLAGQFPNFDLVIPRENDKLISLGVERLSQSVKRAALMADERSHGVKFELSNGSLVISSQSADVGEAREVVPIEYKGEDLGIAFNASYILDFLGVVGSESVVVELKDGQNPALMRPAEEQSLDYRYVVMPMRLM